MSKKVFFLDRDGVLNVDQGYVAQPRSLKWMPGVFEGLQKLQKAGFTLTVVTNQSGIGRGYYTEADMQALHQQMLAELTQQGITIAVIAYCPHAPEDNCNCRKPKRGMIDQIEEKIGEIDFLNSWVIGDKEKDVELGKTIGAKTALVRSQYWKEEELKHAPDIIVNSLLEAAGQI